MLHLHPLQRKISPCWWYEVAFLFSPFLPSPWSKVFEKLGYVTESITLWETLVSQMAHEARPGLWKVALRKRFSNDVVVIMTLPTVSVGNSPIRLPVTSPLIDVSYLPLWTSLILSRKMKLLQLLETMT